MCARANVARWYGKHCRGVQAPCRPVRTGRRVVVGDEFDRLLGAIEELHEVLLIGRDYNRTTGGRLIVASIEVWSEMMVIRFAELGPTASFQVPSVSDDRGTRYMFAGAGGTGTSHLRLNSAVFRPSLHPRAHTLWLRPDEEQQVKIALPPRYR
jgi:hypothetical protein